MSKELSPLEALERIRSHNYHELPKRECLKIIETALKDYDRRLKLAKEYEDVNNVAKRLKAFEVLKELFDFDFAIRFGTNQIMLTIINKRTNEYWELPIPKDKYDLLKEVLL